jgi:cyclic lactone autoinducer peptide
VKKFNKQSLMAVMSAIAVFVAAAVATSACLFWVYQPEEPKSLRDE